mmetsp:Transcript_41678/g.107898  ORF Transcript_41678/g.107898 Transcript_41678/m.107898 type:complete len:272 (-) Transcript_41678:372-1187(-)
MPGVPRHLLPRWQLPQLPSAPPGCSPLRRGPPAGVGSEDTNPCLVAQGPLHHHAQPTPDFDAAAASLPPQKCQPGPWNCRAAHGCPRGIATLRRGCGTGVPSRYSSSRRRALQSPSSLLPTDPARRPSQRRGMASPTRPRRTSRRRSPWSPCIFPHPGMFQCRHSRRRGCPAVISLSGTPPSQLHQLPGPSSPSCGRAASGASSLQPAGRSTGSASPAGSPTPASGAGSCMSRGHSMLRPFRGRSSTQGHPPPTRRIRSVPSAQCLVGIPS